MQIPLRIATFNIENLTDELPENPDREPTFAERAAVLRPALQRIRADVLCLQEIHGQDEPTTLRALTELLQGTVYEQYHSASTRTTEGDNYRERNLVILSRFPIAESQQIKHDHTTQPEYKKVTSIPPEPGADRVTWERPLLYAKIDLPNGSPIHVINLHLKSRRPSNIPGQKRNYYSWRSVSGWAEGFFLSSMKRIGQALETRMFLDKIFDDDEKAQIIVCGDLNADLDQVPVEAIRGRVECTDNPDLAPRVMLPAETTVPEPSRYSLIHHGQKSMLDHILVSRSLMAFYRKTEIHNEQVHDESVAFAFDKKFPESDHAPVIADFELS